ncbi:MAG: prephenate dehydrogenase [Chloroflexi bacterium]|nr:prephenate dehydrogenase [Chloroflexota bacterium]
MKVAIIGGAGKMGRWFARLLLKEGFEVVISGRSQAKLQEAQQQLGVAVASSTEAVAQADVVVLSVPVDSFEAVVAGIAPFIRPEQVIVDVTSVKTLPVAAMHRHIKAASVLGMHPLFGPGARSLANQNFVLTPTNEREDALAQSAREWLEARGARVTLMSPEEHDEMMAVILGLAHFIALVSADTLLGMDSIVAMKAISGVTFRVLLTLIESVVSEDAELYAALQMSLPRMAEIEDAFREKARIWADLVRNKDKTGFAERMKGMKNSLEKSVPDFGKAYENMYRLAEKME